MPVKELLRLFKAPPATLWASEYFQAYIWEYPDMVTYLEKVLELYEEQQRMRHERESFYGLEHQFDCWNAQAMGLTLEEYYSLLSQPFKSFI